MWATTNFASSPHHLHPINAQCLRGNHIAQSSANASTNGSKQFAASAVNVCFLIFKLNYGVSKASSRCARSLSRLASAGKGSTTYKSARVSSSSMSSTTSSFLYLSVITSADATVPSKTGAIYKLKLFAIYNCTGSIEFMFIYRFVFLHSRVSFIMFQVFLFIRPIFVVCMTATRGIRGQD